MQQAFLSTLCRELAKELDVIVTPSSGHAMCTYRGTNLCITEANLRRWLTGEERDLDTLIVFGTMPDIVVVVPGTYVIVSPWVGATIGKWCLGVPNFPSTKYGRPIAVHLSCGCYGTGSWCPSEGIPNEMRSLQVEILCYGREEVCAADHSNVILSNVERWAPIYRSKVPSS